MMPAGYVRPDWRDLAPPNRPQGTVYGGQSGLPTSANVDAPLELSGSLTGLVLAGGSSTQVRPEDQARRRRVLVVLSVVLATLVGMGALIVYFAGDIVSGLFH
jgi:hypothetical protein